jgi:hypothetical protein
MSTGKWWLVTCTTFGTWLPGDPRGFQTWRGREYVPPPKRYARQGESTYRAEDYAVEYEAAKSSLTQEPVHFSNEQRKKCRRRDRGRHRQNDGAAGDSCRG